MIQTDFYMKRKDGVNLYRTYSDRNLMIQKVGTDEIYSEAIDVENSGFTYTEADIPIEGEESKGSEKSDELKVADTLEMLADLGVDVSE